MPKKEPSEILPDKSGLLSWAFVLGMNIGDWVVCPLKNKPAIAFSEVKSELHYDAKADAPYWFWREVKWLNTEVPRSNFDQDLLYYFNRPQHCCRARFDAQFLKNVFSVFVNRSQTDMA